MMRGGSASFGKNVHGEQNVKVREVSGSVILNGTSPIWGSPLAERVQKKCHPGRRALGGIKRLNGERGRAVNRKEKEPVVVGEKGRV